MATSAKKSTAKKRTPTKAPSKAAASKAAAPTPAGPEPHLAREQLPIPDAKHVGLTTYDAKDPNTKYPPIKDAAAARGRAQRADRADRRRRLRRIVGVRRAVQHAGRRAAGGERR